MNLPDIFAIIISLSAFFAVINYHFIKLPTTIGVMACSLLLSSSILILGKLNFIDVVYVKSMVEKIDFSQTVVHGMLGALLFAGALQIKFNKLKERLSIIIFLSTFSVMVSTAIIGILTYYLLELLNYPFDFIYCLMFGALISPTDPIAVLAILKKINMSKHLELDITGESLFNDGISFVIFTLLLIMSTGEATLEPAHIALLFAHETLGAFIYGGAVGMLVYWIIKHIDDFHIEILITIALVAGGYELAEHIGVSAPISIVVAGLITGNMVRRVMRHRSRQYLNIFWHVIDEVFNIALFMLLGIEILIISWKHDYLLIAFMAIFIVLFARWISVSIPILIMRRKSFFSPRVIKLLTWGGLRGGLSVSMALLIDDSAEKDLILVMTFACVIFSILVQGTTFSLISGNRRTKNGQVLPAK